MTILFEELKHDLDSLDREELAFAMSHSHILGINYNQRFLSDAILHLVAIVIDNLVVNHCEYVICYLRLFLLDDYLLLGFFKGAFKFFKLVSKYHASYQDFLILGTSITLLDVLSLVNV
jgi:hypothetical protein